MLDPGPRLINVGLHISPFATFFAVCKLGTSNPGFRCSLARDLAYAALRVSLRTNGQREVQMHIVTGANGFIGGALVWQLNQKGIFNIIAVDAVPLAERNLLKGKSYAKFLLKDELWPFLEETTGAQVKAFFHLGACSSTTETNWDFLFENNVHYSQRIFRWCASEKVPLIYASSGATYGDGSLGFDDHTSPFLLKSLNLYGKSKLVFDQWVTEAHTCPPNWYGLKFFNVYGPNEAHKGEQASVVLKAFQQIRETGRLRLFKSERAEYKDGEQLRDFVYVKDITQWMVEMLDKSPASGIYNMGTGSARTWLDLANAVFKALGTTPNIDFIDIPINLKNQYQYFTEAKMGKFYGQGMSPFQWPLEKGVADYVNEHLAKDHKLL